MTGAMSQNKGKRAERDLANWWRVHGYPNASRAVKTGDRFTHDAGDLVLEFTPWDRRPFMFRFVCEVKHHAGGLTELQVAQFGAKLLGQIKASHALAGAVIERRDRQPDPGRWWAHLPAETFAYLQMGQEPPWRPERFVPVRCSVAYLAELLQGAGLAERTGNLVRFPASTPDGSATEAVTASGGDTP